MASTVPPKTVTFKLPSDDGSGSRTSTPDRVLSPHLVTAPDTRTQPTVKSPPPSVGTIVKAKAVHPRKLEQSFYKGHGSEERPKSRPGSDLRDVLLKQKQRSPVPTRERSPLFERQTMSPSEVARVASKLRETTNSKSHDDARSLKFEAAKLREHLLKVEEEIKHLTRGKHTLEIAIQDTRRALSVNQQSLSTQQKKTRTDADGSLKLLREEAQVLSKSKRGVEHHLQTVKTHLQSLDSARKTLHTKISTLSRALELDAQNFKLYASPVSVRSDRASRQRQYASGCPTPKARAEDTGAAQLCSQALALVTASRGVRGEIKSLVVSVQARKIQAHERITAAVAKNMEEAKTHKREILLERGQLRLAQNSTNHQKHNQEIAMGIALGPLSDIHRSVSEKHDRPLSRVRPASAVEERANFKETTTKLTRQLSATTVRASRISETEHSLSRQMRDKSHSVSLDSHTLRIRKISLDNRWVQ